MKRLSICILFAVSTSSFALAGPWQEGGESPSRDDVKEVVRTEKPIEIGPQEEVPPARVPTPATSTVKEVGSPASGDPSTEDRALEDRALEDARKAPRVDVVFVLDTTGSMSGLIHAAKEKIWAIANTLATAKPAPEIRIGLVAYRDRKDEYITRRTDLTLDLDQVFTELMEYQAKGGGDGPESVNQALHEAVTQMTWTTDEFTYRTIFLVGDAPPHMDYEDDVHYPQSCKMAAEAGIAINTIQCGNLAATTPIWTEIAAKAEGRSFRVEQSGGAILADTPFDARLAELSKELDSTRVFYGNTEKVAELQKRGAELYSKASSRQLAQRVGFNCSDAGMANWIGIGNQDLVCDFLAGSVDFDKLKTEDLPEDLRGKTTEELKAWAEERAKAREAIQAQIAEISGKRDAHIKAQLAETEEGKLDVGIFECLRVQAANKGIVYEGGPKH